jgi:sialic acid synthase SpsE
MELNKFLDNYDSTILHKPYIIAEAGVNHEGSMELAKRLVDEAYEGGANAIKFQTYKADKIASKHSPSYWDTNKEPTRSQHELFKKYDIFNEQDYVVLKQYCDNVGIEFMSTPFDVNSAEFLNHLMSVFKVSSSDITNLPFLEYICKFEKPIVLSTGASYIWEIYQAVELIEKFANKLCLMHCILNYPTENHNANLGMIKDLVAKFPGAVPGYSDHTLPFEMETCLIANILGAAVIEKHFTFDKSLKGNDHYHAMDKNDLKKYCKKLNLYHELLGKFKISSLKSENPARINARRSLVAAKKINKGKIINFEDLTWKRPAHGISPKYINEVVGKSANVDILEDDILSWNLIL